MIFFFYIVHYVNDSVRVARRVYSYRGRFKKRKRLSKSINIKSIIHWSFLFNPDWLNYFLDGPPLVPINRSSFFSSSYAVFLTSSIHDLFDKRGVLYPPLPAFPSIFSFYFSRYPLVICPIHFLPIVFRNFFVYS